MLEHALNAIKLGADSNPTQSRNPNSISKQDNYDIGTTTTNSNTISVNKT